MNLAIVCYPTLGGSGVIATELAVGLAERGHVVHVIANAPPQRTLPTRDGLHFHEVSATEYPLFDHPPYALALASAIMEVHEQHHLDVVNVHYAIPHAASAYLARQALGLTAPRTVVTLHGTDVTRLGADPRYRSITRFTVASADAITVPSEYLRRAAYSNLELPTEPGITVIPNFVDTDRFAPPSQRDRSCFAAHFGDEVREGPVLFHVSNFRPVKRTVDLIDVLARLRRTIPARLVLVGEGPDRQHAEQRARELGLTPHVRFLGNRPDFVDLAKQADGFVLTSESESFGVAALEALSCGVPVFGYRVGGLSEVVVDGVGVLVEPCDADALADAIATVVSDRTRRDAMGTAARVHTLARFRREPVVERYEALFDSIAARPSGERS